MNKNVFSDEPIKKVSDDRLEVKKHVDGFARFIRECDTPLTISIQGKWGSGKTSFFQMVQNKIEDEQKEIENEHQIEDSDNEGVKVKIQGQYTNKMLPKCCFVTFNAWRYSQFNKESNLPASLLASIANQIDEQLVDEKNDTKLLEDQTYSEEKQKRKERKNSFKKGIALLAAIGNRYLEKKTGANIKEEKKKVENDFNDINEFLNDVDDLSKLQSNFEGYINDILEEKFGKRINKNTIDSRMIVFIDDLDRLIPEKAVDLLDTIKIFLDCPSCVFVLAVDYDVVIKGVEAKYKGMLDKKKKKDYFEKIIQVVFRLPNAMLSIEGYITSIAKELKINIAHAKDLVLFARKAEKDNPRGIKRLINNYRLITTINEFEIIRISKKENGDDFQRYLFGFLCLSEKEPEIFDALCESHENLLESLYDYYTEDPTEDNSFIKFFIDWLLGEKDHKSVVDLQTFKGRMENQIAKLERVLNTMNYSYDSNASIAVESISFSLPKIDINDLEANDDEGREVYPCIEKKLSEGSAKEAYIESIKLILDYCYEEGLNKIKEKCDFLNAEKNPGGKGLEKIHINTLGTDLYVQLYEDPYNYCACIQKLAELININVLWKNFKQIYSVSDNDKSTQEEYFDLSDRDELFLPAWEDVE
ncbi:MAG: KAP family NTPase [Lachnospiraceae bacterium]|nr:KAP family NTPase [Lachnospiraceae bacterium]